MCSWTIVKLHNSHGSLLIKTGDMFNNVIIQKWSINKYSGYQKCTELWKQSRLPYPVRFIRCGVCPDISTSEGAADSGGGHLRNRHWQLNESSVFYCQQKHLLLSPRNKWLYCTLGVPPQARAPTWAWKEKHYRAVTRARARNTRH